MPSGNFAKDIIGKRYNRLVVIAKEKTIDSRARWRCRCDCGKEVIVRGIDMRRGVTKSCGCIRKEYAKKNRTIMITINGETMSMKKWLDRLYMYYSTMQRRAKRNNTDIVDEVIKEYNSRDWD